MLSFPNAKINIGLHITAKRPDGYHDLETVFYPVKIYDALEINEAATTSIAVHGMDIAGLPEDNICIKAFNLLNDDFSLPAQAIHLLKQIPIGAGLGGGSADAAFLLKMLNERFQLQLADDQLEDYARKLGADCAFFIKNKPVYATGRGDIFSPVQVTLSDFKICVVKPALHISTQQAFSGVVAKAPEVSLEELVKLPVACWKENIKNDFEATVCLKYPQIAAIKNRLYAAGAIFAQMSGSGSAVFGIFEDKVVLTDFNDCKVYYDI